MLPQSRRRRPYIHRASRTTASSTAAAAAAMSGLTISKNNQSSSSSLSSTPNFPTFSPIPSASPNPSTAFGFLTKSAPSTTPSLPGSTPAASSGLQPSDSSAAAAAAASSPAPLFSSLFGSSCSFGESCFLGCSTGANTSSISFGSTDSKVSSSIPPVDTPISTGSVKMSPGSETPVQEKTVIEEEENEEDSVDILQKEEFDGFAMAADKIALLLRIQRQHPSCLSSLSLRSKSHRRAAYDHLLQVIEDLKAIGCDGDGNSYVEIVASLDDLEFYGFDMSWFRVIVVEFEKSAERRLEVRKETEAKRKAREELVKQIEAIDAELAETEVLPPLSLKTLSALFE